MHSEDEPSRIDLGRFTYAAILNWGNMTSTNQEASMSVMHVTEASGGGVLQVMTQMSRHQLLANARVSIAFTDRYDTPSQEDLATRFRGCKIFRLGQGNAPKRLWAIFFFVRGVLSQSEVDVVHVHSSLAGVVGRLAKISVPRSRTVVVYSPHAFAFLRTDQRRITRWIIRGVEWLLGHISDGTIAISSSETTMAQRLSGLHRVQYLPNCLEIPEPAETLDRDDLVIANSGRLVPQKGPERFRKAAERFSATAKFVWIGGPTDESTVPDLGPYVEVTGQVTHRLALEKLGLSSIHLFTSKWEGMPLALMESQAMGIPAIAWKCPGVSDVVIDGKTGYIVSSEDEMFEKLAELIDNRDLRADISRNALHLRTRFTSEGYGSRSLDAYKHLHEQRKLRKARKRLPVKAERS